MSFCCWTFGCCYCKDNYVKGKVAIITGGNQGIGYYTAKALVLKGMRVIIASRSKEKGTQAQKKLSSYGQVDFIECDLASLESIRSFVEKFHSLGIPLHCLINNAGIMASPYQKTKDGFELQFGVNHLGHFYLTLLLMDILKANAPSRIVNVSSTAHLMAGKLPFDILPHYNDGKNFSSMGAYSYSKAANILFTYELQKRLKDTGVSAVAVHPGVIRTNLWQYINPYTLCICKCATDGAKPVIYAATSSSIEQKDKRLSNSSTPLVMKMEKDKTRSKGVDRYFVPACCCTAEVATDGDTYLHDMQLQLWDMSIKWTGLEGNDEILKHIKTPSEGYEGKDYKPSAFQYFFSFLGNCPCCWCCA